MLHQTIAPKTMTTKTSAPISVLLVDDDPNFRSGLQTLLNFYSDITGKEKGQKTFKVVGQAASVDQAIALVKQQKPNLIFLDLELGTSNGIEFLSQYVKLNQSGKVLALSGHSEDEWIFKAMQAGARGYLVKQNLSTQLYQAITTLMQGHIYLTADIASGFFRLFHFYSGQSLLCASAVNLTPRETEILQCLADGNSNKAISQQLYITVGTVKWHMQEIFRKLQVKSRNQAALKALKLGLVQCK